MQDQGGLRLSCMAASTRKWVRVLGLWKHPLTQAGMTADCQGPVTAPPHMKPEHLLADVIHDILHHMLLQQQT